MTLRTQALRVGAALALTIAGMGAASVPAVAEDAVCATGGGYADPFYPGPGSSSPYDGNFANGAPINASLIDGDYVPPGLAWWPNWNGTGTSALLITAYHDPDHDKVPDRTSAIFGLEMNGASYVRGLGHVPIEGGHNGGIAVVGSWVYVADGTSIRRYTASSVATALAGASPTTVLPSAGSQGVGRQASFLGGGNGSRIWVGTHDTDAESTMEAWDQSATGALTESNVVRKVPAKTQGMVETSTRFLFSTSYGRNDRSNIWVTPKNITTSTYADGDDIRDANSYCMRAPSMSEGMAIGAGRVWVNYEGGSHTYTGPTAGTDWSRNPIKHVHTVSSTYLAGRPIDIASD